MTRKKAPLSYLQVLQKLRDAGISGAHYVNSPKNRADKLAPLQERVDKILRIIRQPNRKPTNMLFFVMYDIESNKVRYNVVKYLERQGCTRIQKSIFLADIDRQKYEAIRQDLAEVQALYHNHDSIIICPVSTELLRSMKVIGKSIDIDIITHNRNTLFF